MSKCAQMCFKLWFQGFKEANCPVLEQIIVKVHWLAFQESKPESLKI